MEKHQEFGILFCEDRKYETRATERILHVQSTNLGELVHKLENH